MCGPSPWPPGGEASLERWEPQKGVSGGQVSAEPTKRPHLRSRTQWVGSQREEPTDLRDVAGCAFNSQGWGREETSVLHKVWGLGWTFYL